ncbi:HNH endonuclease [Mycobacterium sp. PSTR-4-N]|uniref:HNH endonuclease n=1 Tax=Mycobacterium sp. PSTR-4-N TaxID=2917745 RepID=UPI001F14C952|nr:HNH endonuclease [Mycobacterium sp. PSTR-4-N]MCG7592397.1 HNH endonuclease [Mycobacterium sp. PSTR-4-N]
MWERDPDVGRTVPYKLQQACFKRDHWTCQQCGFEAEPNKGQVHADHIINRAEGGEDLLENLITRCVPCHGPKTQAEATRGRERRSGKRPPRRHPADALTP